MVPNIARLALALAVLATTSPARAIDDDWSSPPPAETPTQPTQPGRTPAPPVPAIRRERPQVVLGMSIDHQFENFAEVEFTDGSTAKVGDAVLSFYAGMAAPLTASRSLELEATIGYRFAKVNASNGTITYSDIPIEATLHANTRYLRVGAGPSLHLAPHLYGSGVVSDLDVTFQTAIGAVGSVELIFGGRSRYSIGGRALWLQLHSSAGDIDASGIGLFFAGYL